MNPKRCPICQKALEGSARQCPYCKYHFPEPKNQPEQSKTSEQNRSFCLSAGVTGIIWFFSKKYFDICIRILAFNSFLVPLIISIYGWFFRGDPSLPNRDQIYILFILLVLILEVYPLGKLGGHLLQQQVKNPDLKSEIPEFLPESTLPTSQSELSLEEQVCLLEQKERKSQRHEKQLGKILAFPCALFFIFCHIFTKAVFLYFSYNW